MVAKILKMTIRSFTLKIVAKIKYTVFNSFLFSVSDEICYNSLTDSDGTSENEHDSLIYSGADEICYSSLTDLISTDSDGMSEKRIRFTRLF